MRGGAVFGQAVLQAVLEDDGGHDGEALGLELGGEGEELLGLHPVIDGGVLARMEVLGEGRGGW